MKPEVHILSFFTGGATGVTLHRMAPPLPPQRAILFKVVHQLGANYSQKCGFSEGHIFDML